MVFPLAAIALVAGFVSPIGQGTAATFRLEMGTVTGAITSDQVKTSVSQHWADAQQCVAKSTDVRQHRRFKGWAAFDVSISPQGRIMSARKADGYLEGFDDCFQAVLYKITFPTSDKGTLAYFTLHANE